MLDHLADERIQRLEARVARLEAKLEQTTRLTDMLRPHGPQPWRETLTTIDDDTLRKIEALRKAGPGPIIQCKLGENPTLNIGDPTLNIGDPTLNIGDQP